MAQEYEVVSNPHFRYLNIFLVRMVSRTRHIHGELELSMVLDGSVILQNSTQRCRLSQGDVYLVNSLEAHEFAAEGKDALILSVQLSALLLEQFLTERSSLQFLGSSRLADHLADRQDHYKMLSMLLVELAYAYLGSEADYEYKCFGLTAQLLYRLKRDLPNQTISQQAYLPMQKKSDRMLSVINYIEENFTSKLLLEDIARRENVSMTYLSHLFKDTLGVSFQDYLKQKRFEYACNLIVNTQRKILDISISSGFSDVRYLTKLFQERYGCTPKEYRKGEMTILEPTASPLESTEYLFAPQDGFLLLAPVRGKMRQELPVMSADVIF